MGGREVQKPLLSETNVSADGFFVPFLSAGVMGRPVRCVPKEKCSLALVIFAMLAMTEKTTLLLSFLNGVRCV